MVRYVYCFTVFVFSVLTATSTIASPQEQQIRQFISEVLDRGDVALELVDFSSRSFAGDEGEGRIAIQGQLRLTEDLYERQQVTALRNDLRAAGFSDEEIEVAYGRYWSWYKDYREFIRVSYAGLLIDFEMELQYREQVNGYRFNPIRTAYANPAGQSWSLITRSPGTELSFVVGSEAYEQFLRRVMSRLEERRELSERPRQFIEDMKLQAEMFFGSGSIYSTVAIYDEARTDFMTNEAIPERLVSQARTEIFCPNDISWPESQDAAIDDEFWGYVVCTMNGDTFHNISLSSGSVAQVGYALQIIARQDEPGGYEHFVFYALPAQNRPSDTSCNNMGEGWCPAGPRMEFDFGSFSAVVGHGRRQRAQHYLQLN